MKKRVGLVACSLLVMTIAAVAQGAKPKEERRTVTMVLDRTVLNMEHEFVPAAEAMPEDKSNFAPTGGEFKGVRTFAQQIKHVGTTNYKFWSAAVGEKPAVDVSNENGPDSIKTKAEIVKFLKDSFELGHRAAKMLTAENSVELVSLGESKAARLFWVSFGVAHGFDHYGQMVVYLRSNKIVPPASRQGN